MADGTPCSILDCDSKVYARNLCRRHYNRWWARQGRPEGRTQRVPPITGRTIAERMWAMIERDADGCWIWRGALKPGSGYGCLTVDKKVVYSHRVMYELLVEPIPEGLTIDHLCRVRACCNPSHLEPVTMLENVRRAPRSQTTHCPQGHPYDEQNTYVWQGHRYCRACRACRRAA